MADQPGTLKEDCWNLEKGDALLAEVTAFVHSVRSGEPCVVGGHDGVAALELAETILEDIERRSF
jgi:predicted dehydrogenase